MTVDLTFLLALFSAIFGIVWWVDARWLSPARKSRQQAGDSTEVPVLIEYSRSLFPFVFFLLVLRSFIAEPFRIPSESMEPNLYDGDFILVSKYDYGLKMPVINSKLISTSEPKRGDVVVFRYPGNAPNDPYKGTNFIKRIIGLPGDRVEVTNDHIILNGQPVVYQPHRVVFRSGEPMPINQRPIATESLPGKDHLILDVTGSPFRPGSWTVGANEYFVMGDNRDHSDDSRGWGFVPETNLIGKATYIWLNCRGFLCQDEFKASRIGTSIQ